MANQKIMYSLLAFGVFSVFLFVAVVFATDYIETVSDSGFEKKTRPPVAFFHDDHNDKAGIDDCTVCHHVYENGEKTEDMSVGMECSECHLSAPDAAATDLIRVYHLQCGGCHMAQKVGPVMCGECHRKK
jgi:hypothetical protein